MIDHALFVRIEAKEGKEDEVEDFLRSALDDLMEEEGTVNWYAVKFGTGDFAIFDTFGSEKDRLAHTRAGDLELSESELARIDAAFPRGPEPAAFR